MIDATVTSVPPVFWLLWVASERMPPPGVMATMPCVRERKLLKLPVRSPTAVVVSEPLAVKSTRMPSPSKVGSRRPRASRRPMMAPRFPRRASVSDAAVCAEKSTRPSSSTKTLLMAAMGAPGAAWVKTPRVANRRSSRPRESKRTTSRFDEKPAESSSPLAAKPATTICLPLGETEMPVKPLKGRLLSTVATPPRPKRVSVVPSWLSRARKPEEKVPSGAPVVPAMRMPPRSSKAMALMESLPSKKSTATNPSPALKAVSRTPSGERRTRMPSSSESAIDTVAARNSDPSGAMVTSPSRSSVSPMGPMTGSSWGASSVRRSISVMPALPNELSSWPPEVSRAITRSPLVPAVLSTVPLMRIRPWLSRVMLAGRTLVPTATKIDPPLPKAVSIEPSVLKRVATSWPTLVKPKATSFPSLCTTEPAVEKAGPWTLTVVVPPSPKLGSRPPTLLPPPLMGASGMTLSPLVVKPMLLMNSSLSTTCSSLSASAATK